MLPVMSFIVLVPVFHVLIQYIPGLFTVASSVVLRKIEHIVCIFFTGLRC